MPIASEVKESFRRDQFGLSIADALGTMAGKYAAMPEQLLLACAFFLPPIIVAALCAYAIDRDPVRWRRALFAFAVTFAPCAVLLVAWDLSRLLMWSGLGAFFLIVSNAKDAPPDARTTTRVPLVALAALAFLSTGPFVYAHFEGAWADYPAAPSFTRRTPAAKLTYAFLRLYNRRLFVRDWVSDDDGRCELDAPFVEKPGPCAFVMRSGQDIHTTDVWLEPGTYEANVQLAPAERCPSNATPIASIVPNIFWRFGAPRSATRVSVTEPATTTIPFSIDAEESAIAQTEVRVSAVEGCFRVDRVSIVRTDDR
jgi:hypothetical protein